MERGSFTINKTVPKIIGGFDKIIVFVKLKQIVSTIMDLRRFDTSNLATSVLNFTSYPFEIFTQL